MHEAVSDAIREALEKLSPKRADDRGTWLAVGMAIHATVKGDNSGCDLWEQWSRQSSKFKEGECEQLWNGFKSDATHPVNLGSLRKWANEDNSTSEIENASDTGTTISDQELDDIANKIEVGFGVQSATLDELIADSLKKAHAEERGRWFYQDINGTDVLCVLRFLDAKGEKGYRQYSIVEDKWRPRGIDSQCPLYRLPTLSGADTVVVCEGERATDAATALGYVATTSCQGAQSAAKTDWTPLKGKLVIIFPDNDDPGESYARTIGKIIAGFDVLPRIKIVKLPNLPPKGDVVDYVTFRNSVPTIAIKAGIDDLIKNTPYVALQQLRGGCVLERFSDIVATEVDWLWLGRIPLGRLSLVAGRQGEGKTMMVAGDWAARITRGVDWPDGVPCPKGSVILIAAEDNPSDTLKPRFLAHNGDPSKAFFIRKVLRPKSDGVQECFIKLTDIEELKNTLTENPDVKMVVFDPLGAFLGGKMDSYKDAEVRDVLTPLADLAEQFNVAIVLVAHLKKGESNTADNRVLGSAAFTGVARVVWHLSRDPKNKERRELLQGKNNLCKEMPGLAFTIGGEPARIQWEHDPILHNADDAMHDENQIKTDSPQVSEAIEWLKHELAGGKRSANELKKEAQEAGMGMWAIRQAAAKLKIAKNKSGYQGGWVWMLVEESA